MERAMSVEERIRRAEDIYNKRNGVQYSKNDYNLKTNKKRTRKRLFTQIITCLIIYVIFYAVTNREHIFSEEFRGEVNSFFTEKTKISEWYSNAKTFILNKFNDSEQTPLKEKEQETEENKMVENTQVINTDKSINETIEIKTEENIGGAEEDNIDLSKVEQMKKDAKEIKSNISFIRPIEGRISSTFGWRNPTTETVPKYHTGIDIAANEGTVIKSATDGKIIMASSQGDYGKHYQVQIGEIIIIYAHCKKLYLGEGENIKQGQKIAEVGSTGNSTGPHLHFEIRKGDEKIDPQLVLDI